MSAGTDPPNANPRLGSGESRGDDDNSPLVAQPALAGKGIEISVVRIRPVADQGNLRAFVDLQIGQLILRSLRIIQQAGQRAWVSLPQVVDAEGHYRPVVRCDDEALKARIRDIVLRAWGGQPAPDKHPPVLAEPHKETTCH